MLVDQKVKKFTELLSCTFVVYDCSQLEDVSSVENFKSLKSLDSYFILVNIYRR